MLALVVVTGHLVAEIDGGLMHPQEQRQLPSRFEWVSFSLSIFFRSFSLPMECG